MSTADDLANGRCKPCEGGVDPLSPDQARALVTHFDGWKLSDDGKSIYRKRAFKNFVEAMEHLRQIGEVAEAEQHHPDLHLTGYRNVRVELTTHAIGGLSENDFILAAKIDRLSKG